MCIFLFFLFFFVKAKGGIDFCFFFQAEDGIRYGTVTGVQTCALPISPSRERIFVRTAAVSIRSQTHGRHLERSEERRVGKECRSRWSPYHYKKKRLEGGAAVVRARPRRRARAGRGGARRRRAPLRRRLGPPRPAFFCQAEDGIRDGTVTGVQTCALPISSRAEPVHRPGSARDGPPTTRGESATARSEERRVGKECSSRWAPYHQKKKERAARVVTFAQNNYARIKLSKCRDAAALRSSPHQ